jgi:tetratricopeptide (TPR) repeat protein
LVNELPDEPEILSQLRGVFLDRIDDAQKQHFAFEQIKPTVERARALAEKGQFDDARKLVRELGDQSRESALLRESYLEQIDSAEKQAQALEQIREILERSRSLAQKGDFIEARKTLESLPEDSREIVLIKENMLSQIGQIESEFGSPEAATLRIKAVEAFNAERSDEASAFLRRALVITPTSQRLKEELSVVLTARAFERAKSMSGAPDFNELIAIKEMLTEALSLDPKNKNARQSLNQIVEILGPTGAAPTERPSIGKKWWHLW